MTINVPLENTTEDYTDKADTEHDDDTDVESEDVLNTLTGLTTLPYFTALLLSLVSLL